MLSSSSERVVTADASMKFDDLGVVPSLDEGRAHLSVALQISDWSREFADSLNGVFVQFGRGPVAMCYEVVAPLGQQQLALALRKGGHSQPCRIPRGSAGAASRLRDLYFRPLGTPKPAVAYERRNIRFLMSPLNFIVELINRRSVLRPHLRYCRSGCDVN